ncbi:MAG: DnaJ domain-containing protein [Deltaproteobacteria bacterium]|nr:DnaJ domain-containing protein [Deltaproteobacteria bacterium]
MLTYYLTLGLSPDVSDDDIRKSYLNLVKKNTPEKNPDRFRQITEAYEKISTRRRRIEAKIFNGLAISNYEEALYELVTAREMKKARAGLRELFKAEKKLREK